MRDSASTKVDVNASYILSHPDLDILDEYGHYRRLWTRLYGIAFTRSADPKLYYLIIDNLGARGLKQTTNKSRA